MDPDTAWNELRTALAANDRAAACEYAAALLHWLDGGGFPPSDLEATDLDDEAACFAVRRTCLAVLDGQAVGGER